MDGTGGELGMKHGGSLVERLTAIEDRMLDALRSPAAARVATDDPTGSIASFRGRRYCVLVSYRKDGTPVPSPLWFGERDGKLYVHTGGFKAKRIARNPRVRVAPCTFRGVPVAPPMEATARLLPEAEGPKAEAALEANFGIGRRLYYLTLGRGQKDLSRYIEITPDVR